MNKKETSADISYFRLSLLAFLRESHPHLATDEKFINARTETTLDVYEQAVKNGSNPIEATEQANEALYQNLYFSKHDTIKNILWNEFFNEVPEDNATELAIKLLLECETVFANYLIDE